MPNSCDSKRKTFDQNLKANYKEINCCDPRKETNPLTLRLTAASKQTTETRMIHQMVTSEVKKKFRAHSARFYY